MNYPILDGRYLYDKINKKIEKGEDINVYEQFYLWSIENRSNVLYTLFVILIITIVINDIIEYRNNKIIIKMNSMNNINSMNGGSYQYGGISNPFRRLTEAEKAQAVLEKENFEKYGHLLKKQKEEARDAAKKEKELSNIHATKEKYKAQYYANKEKIQARDTFNKEKSYKITTKS